MAALNAVYVGLVGISQEWYDSANFATGLQNVAVVPNVMLDESVDISNTVTDLGTITQMPTLLPVSDLEPGEGGGGATVTYKLRARDLGSPGVVYTTWVSTDPNSSPPGAPPVGPWGEKAIVQKWLV